MIWIATIIALFLGTSRVLGVIESPKASPKHEPDCHGLHGPKNYPNPKQVNTYFQCVSGRPIKLWCPSRQNFNAAKGECEPIQDIDKYPDVDRSKITCHFQGEFICNRLNPRSYYQCANGVPYLHDCPAGLVFNKRLNTCDYSAPTSGCGFPDCPNGQKYNPANQKCEDVITDRCLVKQLSNGYYPVISSDCEYYFKCKNSHQDGDLLKCPEGMKFDPRTMECEADLSIVCYPCGTKAC